MPDYRVTVTLRVHADNGDEARGRVQVALFQLARTGQSNLLDLDGGPARGYRVHDEVREGEVE